MENENKTGSVIKFSAWAVLILLVAQVPAAIIIFMIPKGITSGMIFCISQIVLTLALLIPISKKTSILSWKETFRLTARPNIRVYFFAILGLIAVSAIGTALTSIQYVLLPDNINLWLDQMYVKNSELYGNMFYSGFNWGLLLAILGAGIIVPVYEELVFRGYLQKNIEVVKGPTMAIVITALIFTILHFNIAEIIPLFILALYIGILAFKTNSLLIVIVCHALNNTFAIIKMNLTSSTTSVSMANEIVPIWIAGVMLVLGIGVVIAIFKYFFKPTNQ